MEEDLNQKAPVKASSEEALESIVAFNEVCETGSTVVLERWTGPTILHCLQFLRSQNPNALVDPQEVWRGDAGGCETGRSLGRKKV